MKNKKSVNELALDLLSKGYPVTPEQLDTHIGRGPYAAKCVCLLRKQGHNISTIREGRHVKHYQYNVPVTAQDIAQSKEVKEFPEQPAIVEQPVAEVNMIVRGQDSTIDNELQSLR